MRQLTEKEVQWLETFTEKHEFFIPILEQYKTHKSLTNTQYYWINLFIKLSQAENSKARDIYLKRAIVKIPCPHCNFLCPTQIKNCPKCGEPLPKIEEISKTIGVFGIQEVNHLERSIINSLERQVHKSILLKDEFDISSTCYVKVNEDITGLSLSNCKLDHFPREILKLTSLKHLALRRNNIDSLLSNIGFLSDLEYLNLRLNKLRILPTSIGLLTKLKCLNVSSNNLMKIPQSIGNLEKLRDLNLSNNKLKNIPDSIGNLKSLENLNIKTNFWINLPETILRLKEQGLKIIT